MIHYGRQKPLFVFGETSASYSNSVSPGSWTSLLIPNKKSGELARWVVLSIGYGDDLYSQRDIYVHPGYASDDEPAVTTFSPIIHDFDGAVLLDVAGFSYLHVQALSDSNIAVCVMPVEGDGYGEIVGPLLSPPKIAAAGTVVSATNAAWNELVIPDLANGSKAKWILLSMQTVGAKMLLSPVAAPVSDAACPMLWWYEHWYLLNVSGHSSIWVKLTVGTSKIRATPLENM